MSCCVESLSAEMQVFEISTLRVERYAKVKEKTKRTNNLCQLQGFGYMVDESVTAEALKVWNQIDAEKVKKKKGGGGIPKGCKS